MVSSRAAERVRRRPHLDRDVILDAATELAANAEPITVRALGAALSADPTAIYRHFRDKDELVRAVFDRLLVGILRQIDGDLAWREQLRSMAELTLQLCVDYPTVGVEAPTLTTEGPGELSAIELLLEQFKRSGLTPTDAVRFYAVFASYLLALGASFAAYRLSSGREAMGASWIGDLGPVDSARFPGVAAARSDLAALTDAEIFMTGVEVILDAAEATVARGRRRH